MFRSVLAVAVGYIVVAAATFLTLTWAGGGLRPAHDAEALANPSFTRQLLFLAASVLYGVAGGYSAAALAPPSRRRHALSVGVAVAALAFASLASGRGREPSGFLVLRLLLAIPAAVAGGWLRYLSSSRSRTADGDAGGAAAPHPG